MTDEGPEALERVADALRDLNGALEALWGLSEPLGIDDTTLLVLIVREQIQKFRFLEASLESLLVNLMPTKEHATPYGRLEQHTTSKKITWDTSLLVPKIAQAALAQNRANEDGEPENAVEAITRAMLETASISYFRLGALDGYGIDGKQYREVEWGRKTVKIIPVTPPGTPEK